MAYNFYIRLWTIIIASLSSIILYYLVLKPFLIKKCLLNTQNCMQLAYQKYKNTILIHMQPTGYWIWYDGKDILLYGEPTGRICTQENTEPAYIYDTSNKQILGYKCVSKLNTIKDFYDKQTKVEYIFDSNIKNMNMYEIINYLVDKNIITISN